MSTDLDVIKKVLWILSNLVCENSGSEAFLNGVDEGSLFERCLLIMRNKNYAIATEASYVIANALNQSQ